MREKFEHSERDRRVLVYLAVLAVCVLTGPFGTAVSLPFWERLVYWTVSITCVGLVMELSISAAIDSPALRRWHISVAFLLGSMIGALPGTAFIIFISQTLRPGHFDSAEFPRVWAQVTAMAVAIGALDMLVSKISHTANKALAPESGQPNALHRARLFERLDDRVREGALVSLSMQDHYVEITTTTGSEFILMRLTDAIDLLDGLSGVRTHRSHWIPQSSAVALHKDGRRHVLELSNGKTVPVSKTYLPDVAHMLDEKERAKPALSHTE